MEDNRLETVDEELLNEISDYNGEYKDKLQKISI